MNKIRYPFRLFIVGFIGNILFRYFWLLIPSIILMIIGIFVKWCLYVGLVLLVIDLFASFIDQMTIRKTMLSDSDNEQFRNFQDALSKDADVFENIRDFVDNTIEEYVDDERLERNKLVIDMWLSICEKCDYGDSIEKLNEYERVFFVTETLEQEVNNGGFSQFFYNSSGDFSNELVDAFTKIGAFKTAEICKKALAVFNGKVPTARGERQDLLDSLECDDVLNEYDDAFYDYEDNLEALNHAYITKHREFFDS